MSTGWLPVGLVSTTRVPFLKSNQDKLRILLLERNKDNNDDIILKIYIRKKVLIFTHLEFVNPGV